MTTLQPLSRELALFKVSADGTSRAEIMQVVDIFRAKIVDVSAEHVMIEIAGQEKKIEAFIDAVRPFGILELVRSGRIALLRGKTASEIPNEEAVEPDTVHA